MTKPAKSPFRRLPILFALGFVVLVAVVILVRRSINQALLREAVVHVVDADGSPAGGATIILSWVGLFGAERAMLVADDQGILSFAVFADKAPAAVWSGYDLRPVVPGSTPQSVALLRSLRLQLPASQELAAQLLVRDGTKADAAFVRTHRPGAWIQWVDSAGNYVNWGPTYVKFDEQGRARWPRVAPGAEIHLHASCGELLVTKTVTNDTSGSLAIDVRLPELAVMARGRVVSPNGDSIEGRVELQANVQQGSSMFLRMPKAVHLNEEGVFQFMVHDNAVDGGDLELTVDDQSIAADLPQTEAGGTIDVGTLRLDPKD